MALIVETGSGSATAESYISVADATTYHNARGNEDAWDAIDDKEAALRKATDYMGQKYRGLWAGVRANNEQALDWPRYDVPKVDGPGGYRSFPNYYPFDVVPVEIMRACAELALKTADGELLVDTDRATQSESVGPLSVTYFDSSGQQKRFAAVDGLLRPFIGAGNAYTVKVNRA